MFQVKLFYLYRSDKDSSHKTILVGPHLGGTKTFIVDIPTDQFKAMVQSDFNSFKNVWGKGLPVSYGSGPVLNPKVVAKVSYNLFRVVDKQERLVGRVSWDWKTNAWTNQN